jgi:hypothetical protein
MSGDRGGRGSFAHTREGCDVTRHKQGKDFFSFERTPVVPRLPALLSSARDTGPRGGPRRGAVTSSPRHTHVPFFTPHPP